MHRTESAKVTRTTQVRFNGITLHNPILKEAGFAYGDRYDLIPAVDGNSLWIGKYANGLYQISGTYTKVSHGYLSGCREAQLEYFPGSGFIRIIR